MCNTVLSGESRRASSSVWRHFSNCPPVYCSFARLISTVARALFHFLIATSFWVGSFGPVDWHPAAASNVIRPVARTRRFKRMIRLHTFGDIPLGLFPGPRQEHCLGRPPLAEASAAAAAGRALCPRARPARDDRPAPFFDPPRRPLKVVYQKNFRGPYRPPEVRYYSGYRALRGRSVTC